jgi:hypothetical protein
MATNHRDLAVGVFEHRWQAEHAVVELWKAGFAHDRVDLVTRDGATQASPNLHLQEEASEGALAGAAAGAGLGAVAGAAAAMLIPGIGTVLGGGLLAGLIGGAALGAAGGTFVGPFIALEMAEDDAHYYSHAVDEGRTVVVVKDPHRGDEAREILRKAGAQERVPAPV